MKKTFLLLLLAFLLPGGCGEAGSREEIPGEYVAAGPAHTKERGEVRTQESTREEQASEEEIPNEEVPENGQAERQFLYDGAVEYAARSLSSGELLWYNDIKQTLGSFGEKVSLSGEGLDAGCDETDIDRLFQCVLNDHPELFFVEGYSYTKYTRGDRITSIDFSGTYSMDRETAEARRKEIEAGAESLLAGIDGSADQYTKVKYVYDTIIRETDYDPASPDNQNIYSVFVNHSSVCQGYAKAVQYLLNRLGVECTLVLGTVETDAGQEGHAWNLVKVDGSYYYLDATWGDASYSLQDGQAAEDMTIPEINYDYLNVTTEELLRSHSLKGTIPMPQCIAIEANYYAKEGALFSSYDREQMQALFDRAKAENREGVAVKCTSEECYFEILTGLVDDQEIFLYFGEESSTVAYAQNDSQMSLTFWVTNQ